MSALGVLVAGGRGVRLGLDTPKALVTVGGRTLLDRALDTLGAACDAIVVAAPASLALPLPAGVRRVDDPPDAPGPLAGMLAALGASPFERALVLGVDFPLMTPETLRALLARLDEATAAYVSGACNVPEVEAVIPAPDGIAQPLAAAYAPAALAVLTSRFAAGERAPSRAIGGLRSIVLDDREIADLPGGSDAFFNLNTPADLETAERRLATRTGER